MCATARTTPLPCVNLCLVNLAIHSATAPQGLKPGDAPQRSAAPESQLRVLVVDDSRANRQFVVAVLARWGIVPTIACDGSQAVQLTKQQVFDIVLMDIVMPVMDGIVATAKIRQAERETPGRTQVPIVAYTSLDLTASSARLGRIGLTAVLAKPCSSTTLRSCLAQHCPDKFSAHL